MSLHGVLVGRDSARVLLVVLDGGQIVFGLFRLGVLEESDDGDLIVLDEFGDLGLISPTC